MCVCVCARMCVPTHTMSRGLPVHHAGGGRHVRRQHLCQASATSHTQHLSLHSVSPVTVLCLSRRPGRMNVLHTHTRHPHLGERFTLNTRTLFWLQVSTRVRPPCHGRCLRSVYFGCTRHLFAPMVTASLPLPPPPWSTRTLSRSFSLSGCLSLFRSRSPSPVRQDNSLRSPAPLLLLSA